jgi:molybdenum-dependent DNA-binding transcriptional regulator ModE
VILTLTLAAERLGVTGPDAARSALKRIRILESVSGRTIVVMSGRGKQTRYMVLERELDSALEGEFRQHVDAVADRIRGAQQAMEARIDALAGRIERLEHT